MDDRRLPDLADFRPPYQMGAQGCVVVGFWRSLPRQSGFEALRWKHWTLGVALCLHYNRPAVQYPVPYREVIGAYIVRDGLRVAAVPFDLALDDSFHVDAGRTYYQLPKRFDSPLTIDFRHDAVTVAGSEVNMCARSGNPPLLRTLLATAVHTLTERIAVLGTAGSPNIAAHIVLRPDPRTARKLYVDTLRFGGIAMRPVIAQSWSHIDITVGVPTTQVGGE